MPATLRELQALSDLVMRLGWTWTDAQTVALERFGDWLADEGARMGGIGPDEIARLWDRHLLDSMFFGAEAAAMGSILDVGSGVGLPGIPLSIAFPEADVTLLDRSGRRADGLRRASAVLGLDVEVIDGDIGRVRARFDRVTFRASLPLDPVIHLPPSLVTETGEAWLGLGRGEGAPAVELWRRQPPPLPAGWVAELWESPNGVLDSTAWLLRIARW
jgi:16S rRNA (guanine(527)-N(7))-methyltransferase RsmG